MCIRDSSISALHVMDQVYVVICSTMDGCGFTAAPCVLVSPTNHRRRLHPTRNATSYSVPLLRTQPPCHRHPPCWLYIPHAVLYPGDIVNSAGRRTIHDITRIKHCMGYVQPTRRMTVAQRLCTPQGDRIRCGVSSRMQTPAVVRG